ncbi:MAG: TRAP transporter substrate-binding protein [Synergistes sp.]|nr:TRAP transporter substrate-binding protein [Synergistes sp.]
MKLQLAHEQPENHPYHVGALEFAKLVKEYSDGEMEVTIFPNATMGKASALAEGCSMGTIDFAVVFSLTLEAYSPKFGVLTMPYCFRDWNHAYSVLDGSIGDELKASVEPKGIKVLAFWRTGQRQIHSRKPIRTPADIKKKKLRVPEGLSCALVSKALGAVTTPMSFGEAYSAMQLKTIDAQTQTINNVYSSKMYEVGKYFTNVNMYFNTQPFIMSMQLWKSLTPKQQDIVMRAAQRAAKVERAYHESDTKTSYEGFVKAGGTVIELNKDELQQWKDACVPVYKDKRLAAAMEIYNKIRKQK